jgi:polysaccharide pyruvyl transferase WcaK-like protein
VVILLSGQKDQTPFPLRTKDGIIMIRVVNRRKSLQSKPSQHLLWILGFSIIYKYLPIPRLREWIRSNTEWIDVVTNSDFVADIRGGDSFSDIYGAVNFLEGSITRISCILLKGKIVQLPQTYGPFKNWLTRSVGRYILRNSHPIVARDTASAEFAKELVNFKRDVRLSRDVAFSMKPIAPEELRTIPGPAWEKVPPGTIGINVNGLMYNGGYTRTNMFNLKIDYPELVLSICRYFMDHTDKSILLIPHTFAPPGNVESDNECCWHVIGAAATDGTGQIRMLDGEHDQHELKSVIGNLDFFIGSRMHSCIAALSQGIPCAAIAYSMKFRGVFASVGMEESVFDGREWSNDIILQKIIEQYKQRESIRNRLAKEIEFVEKDLHGVFACL